MPRSSVMRVFMVGRDSRANRRPLPGLTLLRRDRRRRGHVEVLPRGRVIAFGARLVPEVERPVGGDGPLRVDLHPRDEELRSLAETLGAEDNPAERAVAAGLRD